MKHIFLLKKVDIQVLFRATKALAWKLEWPHCKTTQLNILILLYKSGQIKLHVEITGAGQTMGHIQQTAQLQFPATKTSIITMWT